MKIKVTYISFIQTDTRENQVKNELLNKITEQEGKFAIKNATTTISQHRQKYKKVRLLLIIKNVPEKLELKMKAG